MTDEKKESSFDELKDLMIGIAQNLELYEKDLNDLTDEDFAGMKAKIANKIADVAQNEIQSFERKEFKQMLDALLQLMPSLHFMFGGLK